MAITVGNCLDVARVWLNDVGALYFTNTILLEPFKIAYQELEDECVAHGLQITSEIDDVQSIAAGTLSYTLPSQFVEPISLFERTPGATNDQWDEMVEREFEPNEVQGSTLRYWIYRMGAIKFLGATAAREVKLRYRKAFAAVSAAGDNVLLAQAKNFLGTRTAEITSFALGRDFPRAEVCAREKQIAYDRLIGELVRRQQGLITKRRGYRRNKRPYSRVRIG